MNAASSTGTAAELYKEIMAASGVIAIDGGALEGVNDCFLVPCVTMSVQPPA